MKNSLYSLLVLFLLFGSASVPAAAQKKRSKAKTTTVVTYSLPTDDERRKQIEERMLKGEYQHDGSGDLMYIGTMESVPALLKVLKDHPPYERKSEIPPPPPLPGQAAIQPEPPLFVCTYHHAITALRKITGQKLTWYDEWLAWWKKYQAERQGGQIN
jgi:hypothetical protein